jgi:peptidoglycan hydrolase CwlO-like protein
VNEKEFEFSQEDLLEVVKRLSSEVSELRFELQLSKQEIKRLKKWISEVSEFAIKKNVRSL